MIMTVLVIMLFLMSVQVRFIRSVIMAVLMHMCLKQAVVMAMKILHVVVMIIMLQNHIKIAGIDSRLLNPADFYLVPADRETPERLP